MWHSIEDHFEVIDKLIKEANEKYKGLPLILYGHSMGGNIAAGYVIDKRPTINGLILTGSAIKTPKDLPLFLLNTVLSCPSFIKNTIIPVSYTHLDVYKRQHHNRAAGLHFNGDISQGGDGINHSPQVYNNICLLYTSRCV